MRIYIKTFGCAANQADSEIIAGLLVKAGYELTDSAEDADIVIVNTCIVKGRTETKVLKELERLKTLNKKIIVTGCMTQPKIYLERLRDFSVLGLYETPKIVDAVKEVIRGKKIYWISKEKKEKLCFPRLRKNPAIAVIVISSGCLGQCAYCIVKLAKGELFSYPEEAIIQEIKTALKEGCKEIWLTSQDCAAYGLDNNTNLVKLLEKIIKIEGKFWIRIGMSNPDNILKILDGLVKVYKDPKIYKFLHTPVQSGNNEILKLMKRKYKAEDFKKIISKFRKEIPNITISTDLICGFPRETEEQFQNSLDLINWLKPDVLNLNMFWARPGTLAAQMKQLKSGIGRERTREIAKIFEKIALEKNKEYIGKEIEILIDEKGSKGGFVGRNQFYKPIVVKKAKLGEFKNIKITDATKDYLIGDVSS